MTTYRLQSMLGRSVRAIDGEVGTLYDVYFTDDTWRVEHMIVQTGTFFNHRRLVMNPDLVFPDNMSRDPADGDDILVDATRAEILASPDYSAYPTVSDQKAHDRRLHPYFLWFPTGDARKIVFRPLGAPPEDVAKDEAATSRGENPHLQSFREVRGYGVFAADDGEEIIGHVADFIVIAEDHRIGQVLIDIGSGRTKDILLVHPRDVSNINWGDVHVYLKRSHEELGLPVHQRTSPADMW